MVCVFIPQLGLPRGFLLCFLSKVRHDRHVRRAAIPPHHPRYFPKPISHSPCAEQKFLSSSYEAQVTKLKVPSSSFQAQVTKLKLPSSSYQAQVSKLKLLSSSY